MQVTITAKQKKDNIKLGQSFLKKHLISGFQLEDFNPHGSKNIYYGHDNPKHIKILQKKLGGSTYPRLSFYKWNKDWVAGKNTTLLNNKTLAKAKELYLTNNKIKQSNSFFMKYALHGHKKEIPYSWDVPDIRLFGVSSFPHYKKAYYITKNIDRNSRFATLSTNRKKVEEIKRRMKGERVQQILIQDYKPKKHSFYNFIHSIS